jgi:hypothetical protein
LTQLAPWQIALNLGVVPAAFYRLIWIPHLKFNTTVGFWALQKQILDYHERVGVVSKSILIAPNGIAGF